MVVATEKMCELPGLMTSPGATRRLGCCPVFLYRPTHFVDSFGVAAKKCRGMTISRMSASSKKTTYLRRQTDTHHGLSWAVAIQRRGKSYQRQFGDRQYGGCDEARGAAESYLQSLLAVLPYRSRVRERYVTTKTGVTGVIKTWEWTRTGVKSPYFKAYWPKPGEPGKVISRKFSISKYGRKEAFTLAVAARQKGVAGLVPQGVVNRLA